MTSARPRRRWWSQHEDGEHELDGDGMAIARSRPRDPGRGLPAEMRDVEPDRHPDAVYWP